MNKSKLYEAAKKYEDDGRIDKAYQFYLEAALSENDADAMYRLGQMYYEGDYVSQDYDKAGYYFGMKSSCNTFRQRQAMQKSKVLS